MALYIDKAALKSAVDDVVLDYTGPKMYDESLVKQVIEEHDKAMEEAKLALWRFERSRNRLETILDIVYRDIPATIELNLPTDLWEAMLGMRISMKYERNNCAIGCRRLWYKEFQRGPRRSIYAGQIITMQQIRWRYRQLGYVGRISHADGLEMLQDTPIGTYIIRRRTGVDDELCVMRRKNSTCPNGEPCPNGLHLTNGSKLTYSTWLMDYASVYFVRFDGGPGSPAGGEDSLVVSVRYKFAEPTSIDSMYRFEPYLVPDPTTGLRRLKSFEDVLIKIGNSKTPLPIPPTPIRSHTLQNSCLNVIRDANLDTSSLSPALRELAMFRTVNKH